MNEVELYKITIKIISLLRDAQKHTGDAEVNSELDIIIDDILNSYTK